MKKQLLGAAVTAVLMAANAQAALPVISSATTSTVYVSGASAQRGYIQKLVTASSTIPAADRICDPAQEIWVFNDNIDGKTQNAYYCSKATTNTSLSAAKSKLLIYKRSEGGSDMGVAPVIANTPVNFLNVNSTTCVVNTQAVAGTTVGVATCNYDTAGTNQDQYTSATIDLGVSDVDPAQFRGNNVSAGYNAVTADDLNKLTVKAASTVVFGEPVTLHLYQALQAAQLSTGEIPATIPGTTTACTVGDRTHEACMPNLTSAQIASIHTGAWADWNQLKVGSTGLGLYDWTVAHAPAYAPAGNFVHVCRRVDGSGTQAQHGIVFLNSPCAVANDAIPPAHDLGTLEGDGATMVHEMSTSGGVNDCLKSLDTGVQIAKSSFDETPYLGGARWAVGLQSLENANNNYEFVKVDGVAPTLAHVVDGSYTDWVENTFQYNTLHYAGLSSKLDIKAVVDTIIAKAALPEVMSALNAGFLHGFGNGAYLAVPSLFTPTSTSLDTAKPINVYSRSTPNASVENCRMPTVYNSGAAKL